MAIIYGKGMKGGGNRETKRKAVLGKEEKIQEERRKRQSRKDRKLVNVVKGSR
jgi:hypothetical protein